MNFKKKTELTGKKVVLKSISEKEIPLLWKMIYSDENAEWKKWDAPYFPFKNKSLDEYKKSFEEEVGYDGIAKRGIWVSDNLIGTVGYYWEHKPSNWLETGITIYQEQYWSK